MSRLVVAGCAGEADPPHDDCGRLGHLGELVRGLHEFVGIDVLGFGGVDPSPSLDVEVEGLVALQKYDRARTFAAGSREVIAHAKSLPYTFSHSVCGVA